MWKDSPKWKNKTKCGYNGVARGGGMRLAAGDYLGKLRANGWIFIDIGDFGNIYRLTEKAILYNLFPKWDDLQLKIEPRYGGFFY